MIPMLIIPSVIFNILYRIFVPSGRTVSRLYDPCSNIDPPVSSQKNRYYSYQTLRTRRTYFRATFLCFHVNQVEETSTRHYRGITRGFETDNNILYLKSELLYFSINPETF